MVVTSSSSNPASPARDHLAWSRLSDAGWLVLRGRTARLAVPVATVVGTVLSAINEGSGVVRGRLGPAGVARVIVNYAVPFLVASWGVLSTHRQHPGGNRTGENDVPRA